MTALSREYLVDSPVELYDVNDGAGLHHAVGDTDSCADTVYEQGTYDQSGLSTEDAKEIIRGWLNEEAVKGVPTEIRLKVALAIDSAQDSGRENVSIGRLVRNAYDDAQLPKSQFRQFITAVMHDSRLAYIGNGVYTFRDPNIVAISKKSLDSSLAKICMESLVEKTKPGDRISGDKILGFAKRAAGRLLTRNEVDSFLIAVASDARFTPEEDGSFTNNGTAANSAADPFVDSLDIKKEYVYSRHDWGLARRLYPRSVNRALFGRNKHAYRSLTRGADHVNPGKFQEAHALHLRRIQAQLSRRRAM